MLFGHQNDDQPADNSISQTTPSEGMSMGGTPVAPAPDHDQPNPLAVDPDTGVSLPVAPDSLEHDSDHPYRVESGDELKATNEAETTPEPNPQTPDTAPVSAPADDDDAAPDASLDEEDEDLLPSDSDADNLLALKQQALQQLSPLVDHLDQTPEEKFRTTMMMIQSSDNQSLIKDAYAAAQQITDDKVRAQALLDIINEINYFTQHTQDQA